MADGQPGSANLTERAPNDERRAIAKKWDDLRANDEWWVVYDAWRELKSMDAAPKGETAVVDLLRRLVFRHEPPTDFALFDLLVQRVLKNKLLGVAK